MTARGVVRFGGVVEPQASVESMVARGMTLVPEKRELFGEMTVEDNLLLGAFQRYRSGERDHAATMSEVYALFPRLQERRAQLAGTLSGGERQMLAVGRALMAKPRLLMLDEPSLGLAPRIVREIFHIIVELKRRGVSILLVEQNARAALQIADYAYVLETGEVVLDGPAERAGQRPPGHRELSRTGRAALSRPAASGLGYDVLCVGGTAGDRQLRESPEPDPVNTGGGKRGVRSRSLHSRSDT